MCMGKLNSLAPVITTSCVTGEGIDLLKKLLFTLPKRRKHEKKANRPFEFLVDDVFNVPGVGPVVSGFVNAGTLTVGSSCQVYIGPIEDGTFMKTVAKSAHIARISTSFVTSGQSACLALALSKDMRKELRRGMVVLTRSPVSTKEFEAEICVLKGEGTTIRRSYQAYVHILNVRQSAFAKDIEIVNNHLSGASSTKTSLEGEFEEIILRPGSRAKVRFEFAQRPVSISMGPMNKESANANISTHFLPFHVTGVHPSRDAYAVSRRSSTRGRADYRCSNRRSCWCLESHEYIVLGFICHSITGINGI